MDHEVRMPDLATTADQITIREWYMGVGEAVRRGEPLLEVETDKATMEVESVATGVLKAVHAEDGAEVAVGDVIAVIEVGDVADADAAPPPADAPAAVAPAPGAAARAPAAGRGRCAVPGLVDTIAPERLAAHDRSFLLGLYERMALIRAFEDGVKMLFLEGSMPGTIHQCQGQEATAVGVCTALEREDHITSTFRGHGHALAKGVSPESMLAELYGASTGCCGGKGGSMHMGDLDVGMVPGIAIVAGGIPLAAGMALAFKLRRQPRVVACFFGDGAVAEGAFHEGVNLAAIWDLPVIYVCENNLYGASTSLDKVMRGDRIADRAAAYGFRGQVVDGNDVLAVYDAARQAAAECRAGRGPVLLELLTYRRTGHSRRDACHYQPREERDAWFRRDPIEVLGRGLLQLGGIDAARLEGIRGAVAGRFDAAVAYAQAQPLPDAADVLNDVFA